METSEIEAIVSRMLSERDAKKHREEAELHIRKNEMWTARLIAAFIGFTLGLGFAILIGSIGSHH